MLENVGRDIPFELEEISIDGSATLEGLHRERIPVVTIDGVEAFTLFVHPGAFRRRLGGA